MGSIESEVWVVTGKIALVTGGNSGLGLETSIKIARMGATVVMVARDKVRGQQGLEEIKRRGGSGRVSLLVCDMASMADVRLLASDFSAEHARLDLLVNNAGSVRGAHQITAEGFEWTFAANYLGHFLLTNLLLALLRRSAPSRIVNVSSVGHRQATLDFANLHFDKGGYSIMNAYGRSKLAQILFTRELARRLEGTGVTVNALHPGAVATGIWTKATLPWYARAPIAMAKRLFMLTPAQGADRIVYLATSPDVEGQTGGYYEKNRLVEPAPAARDPTLTTRLWDESAKMVKLAEV
jgi:NAD(P)-dependent dehydrogenase (short-subunit alcohol dehydrogenase family)